MFYLKLTRELYFNHKMFAHLKADDSNRRNLIFFLILFQYRNYYATLYIVPPARVQTTIITRNTYYIIFCSFFLEFILALYFVVVFSFSALYMMSYGGLFGWDFKYSYASEWKQRNKKTKRATKFCVVVIKICHCFFLVGF